jgi:hypothetical protein
MDNESEVMKAMSDLQVRQMAFEAALFEALIQKQIFTTEEADIIQETISKLIERRRLQSMS